MSHLDAIEISSYHSHLFSSLMVCDWKLVSISPKRITALCCPCDFPYSIYIYLLGKESVWKGKESVCGWDQLSYRKANVCN
jgi:hypothetical protein